VGFPNVLFRAGGLAASTYVFFPFCSPFLFLCPSELWGCDYVGSTFSFCFLHSCIWWCYLWILFLLLYVSSYLNWGGSVIRFAVIKVFIWMFVWIDALGFTSFWTVQYVKSGFFWGSCALGGCWCRNIVGILRKISIISSVRIFSSLLSILHMQSKERAIHTPDQIQTYIRLLYVRSPWYHNNSQFQPRCPYFKTVEKGYPSKRAAPPQDHAFSASRHIGAHGKATSDSGST